MIKNNKGNIPIFLISAILVFLISLLVFQNFKFISDSKNVLSEVVLPNGSELKLSNSKDVKSSDSKFCIDATSKITGLVDGPLKSYSFKLPETDTCGNKISKESFKYPNGFNRGLSHIFNLNEKNNNCFFSPGVAVAKEQAIGNSKFMVYDNVKSVTPFNIENKLYKVVAQTSGPKLTGGIDRCRVNIFNAGESITGKLKEDSRQEYEQVPAKDDKKMVKKVQLVIFNPKIDGKSLIDYFGYNNPTEISKQVFNFFKEASGNTMNYTLVKTTVITDFPEMISPTQYPKGVDPKVSPDKINYSLTGFKYTPQSYKDCISNNANCHSPDLVNYPKALDLVKACEARNTGQVDEIWLWGGPNFGFYESHMVGSESAVYFLNSKPTVYNKCNKPLVVMGYNYQRSVNQAVHNFGHRAESVIANVFISSLSEDDQSLFFANIFTGNALPYPPVTNNAGFLFLSNNKLPTTSIRGCGNTHFTPTSKWNDPYRYNEAGEVMSYCEEFQNYPIIKGEAKNLTCEKWGCDEMGFYKYWWKNIPRNKGTNFDKYSNKSIYNNWWLYIFDIK